MNTEPLNINVERASMEDLMSIWEIDEAVRGAITDRGMLMNTVRDKKCLVAKHGWDVCGFAVRETDFFGYTRIAMIVVQEGHRHEGIGRRLLSYAEKTTRDDRIFASADERNSTGQAFYEALGYKRCGSISGVRSSGSREIIYIKHLSG